MTKREKIISRINKELELNIPLETPIKSHRRKFNDCGGHSWWFDSDDIDVNKYGSSFTITELLKYEKLCLFKEGSYWEILPADNA